MLIEGVNLYIASIRLLDLAAESSTSTSGATDSPSSEGGGADFGAIAGVVESCGAGILATVALVWYCLHRCPSKQAASAFRSGCGKSEFHSDAVWFKDQHSHGYHLRIHGLSEVSGSQAVFEHDGTPRSRIVGHSIE